MDRKKFDDSKKINIKFLKSKENHVTTNKNQNISGKQNSKREHNSNKKSFASQVLNRPPNYLNSLGDSSAMQSTLHSTAKPSNLDSNSILSSSENDVVLDDAKPIIIDHYKTVNENIIREKAEETKLLEKTETPMMDKINNSLKNFQLMKFLSNKNNKIASIIVMVAIVLVILLNLNKGTPANNSSLNQNFNAVDYVSSKNYIHNLENNLTKILSNIEGVGKVSVMITLESGPELKIASNLDERSTTTSNGENSSTVNVNIVKNPIIITQNGKSAPLVLMEIMPKIKGVIVVAQGAKNTKVKLQLLQAVQALLEVANNNIQIYSGI